MPESSTPQTSFDFSESQPKADDIPYGYCQCGCGQKTRIAPRDWPSKNIVKGQSMRYVSGHNRSGTPRGEDFAERPHKNMRRCACGGWKTRGTPQCRDCWDKEGKPPEDPEIYIIGGKPRRRIPLTQGQYAIVDAHNYERLMKFNYYALWSPLKRGFYARRNVCINGKWLGLMMGYDIIHVPDGKIPHHLEQTETLNYCEDNLKAATSAENSQDRVRGINNTSGRKNVHKRGNRWAVRVTAFGEEYDFGSYATFEEACRVQEEAVKAVHGEFACIG